MMRGLAQKSCCDSNRSAPFTEVCFWPAIGYRDAGHDDAHGANISALRLLITKRSQDSIREQRFITFGIGITPPY